MTINYIQPCNYFHVLHSRRGIKMWFFVDRVWLCFWVLVWQFRNATWWFFNMREGFPRELIVLQYLNLIMMIVSHLCRRWTSPIPFGKWEIPFLVIKTCGFAFHNQFCIFQVPKKHFEYVWEVRAKYGGHWMWYWHVISFSPIRCFSNLPLRKSWFSLGFQGNLRE